MGTSKLIIPGMGVGNWDGETTPGVDIKAACPNGYGDGTYCIGGGVGGSGEDEEDDAEWSESSVGDGVRTWMVVIGANVRQFSEKWTRLGR